MVVVVTERMEISAATKRLVMWEVRRKEVALAFEPTVRRMRDTVDIFSKEKQHVGYLTVGF